MASAVEPSAAFKQTAFANLDTDAGKAHAAVKKAYAEAPEGDTIVEVPREQLNTLLSKLSGEFEKQHEASYKAGEAAEKNASKKTPWAWITGSSLISVATTGLIVWAIMHRHDKKLMASLAAANSQNGNGGQ